MPFFFSYPCIFMNIAWVKYQIFFFKDLKKILKKVDIHFRSPRMKLFCLLTGGL